MHPKPNVFLLLKIRPFTFPLDERRLGRLEPHMEREDGEAGGGYDSLCAVSGRSAGGWHWH